MSTSLLKDLEDQEGIIIKEQGDGKKIEGEADLQIVADKKKKKARRSKKKSQNQKLKRKLKKYYNKISK